MATFVENLHPRAPKGSPIGGQWIAGGGEAATGGWKIDAADKKQISRYRQVTAEQAASIPAAKIETDREHVFLTDWTGFGGVELSDAMRHGQITDKDMSDIDPLFDRNRLGENLILHRFFPEDIEFAQTVRGLKPGDGLSDPAYMSTTLLGKADLPEGTWFKDQAEMKILAAKGSRALYLGDQFGNADEHEVLLDRNSELVYIGEDTNDDTYVFRLVQQPEDLTSTKEVTPAKPILRDGNLPSQSILISVEDLNSKGSGFDVAGTKLLEVLINPNERDVMQLLRDIPEQTNFEVEHETLRAVRDVNANVYIWRADEAIHNMVERGLHKTFPDTSIIFDETTRDTLELEKGRLTKYARSIIKRGQENAKKASNKGEAKDTGFSTEVDPERFIEARNASSRASYLSPLKPDDLRNHVLLLNKEGTVGAAISPEGDLQNVFNNHGAPGEGKLVVREAIARGAKTLDCFDGFLPDYYKQFGFEEVDRVKFDPQYAPKNWDYAKNNTPDVVFMRLKGK